MNRLLYKGDISTYRGDSVRNDAAPNVAIVNAANVRMLGGGGVDGAIHRAAGPGLLEECLKIPEVAPGIRCPTGQARITRGANLPAQWVIHTVGPVFHGSPTARGPVHPGELAEMPSGIAPKVMLERTIRSCLMLAEAHGIRGIAFPAISAGVFGGSIEGFAYAADKVLAEREWDLAEVAFYLFGDLDHDVFNRVAEICSKGRP